ncbi:MAG: hypothetical protein AB7I59_01690 [Geminicoccaceae bacterium]
MPIYLVEGFWSSCRVAKVEILAKDPLAALRRARRNEDDWIGDNEECSGDCYGPTNYEVWDADQRHVLACQLSDQAALHEHAGVLLAALKALHARHHAFATSPGWTTLDEEAGTAAAAAIAKAEDTAARLVTGAADMSVAETTSVEAR